MLEPSQVHDISDTARWVAVYRARESERADALFRDPLARRLAGAQGEQIARTLLPGQMDWAFLGRTLLFDRFIQSQLDGGVDTVVNLAAGLDARPYRMRVASGLRWFEVDLPELLRYKNDVLAGETPRCLLERIALDLADVEARRALLERIARDARRILFITEGLLLYLTRDQVAPLADDLSALAPARSWAADLISPAMLHELRRRLGGPLEAAGAPFRFGPREGPAFFERHGWRPVEVGSLLHAVPRHRLPLVYRLLALIPDTKGRLPWAHWGGVLLLERKP
jgi:methyltransferase (TIGR00027 family)